MDLADVVRLHKDHYQELAREYGPTPRGVQYPDEEGHQARFRELIGVGLTPRSSVADFGCGAGAFLDFVQTELGFEGKYYGIDLVDEQLAAGRAKHPEAVFENRNLFDEGLGREVDFIFVNGVFNNRFPGVDSNAYMKEILVRLMPFAKKGLAFNALSTYVDFQESHLYYCDPGEVFRFCKENLSNLVVLRHDYQLKPGLPAFEFTVYVHASDIPLRSNYAG